MVLLQPRQKMLPFLACADAKLPPPERRRVGVGVNSTMQGMEKVATPSRFTSKRKRASQFTDLPLSGGGESGWVAVRKHS
jgi:hypothetical protein